ncbi:glycosyltransferase family 4 protein [Pantanalinema sp. GBBB05]|uniref:glycosyltransferase family 4 protein n=1 Tax=Pantanalinema sp. GBBB05 TaxID=2604139 RepID=UPI001D8375AA|nr:glycosyltransferase family 4 protein [Pantanalinema sp. GBBB05]
MKVLYDVSLLGIAYRNQSTFGLSRTTEALLKELLTIPAVTLTASSDVSYSIWLFVKLYLQQQNWQKDVPFVSNSFNVKLRDLVKEVILKDKKFQPFIENLKRLEIIKSQETEIRLHQWRATILDYKFQGTAKNRLENVDIYHSNYHKIPKAIQENKRIKSFLTVHDLVPILHPEWFEMLEKNNLKTFHPDFNLPEILSGLTSANWIICPSKITKRDLLQYYGDRLDCEKVKVIPWAASDTFYPCQDKDKIAVIKQKYRIPEGQYILGLNTLEPRKNMEGLIRAFYRILQQEKINDLYLVLAGKLGWQYESIFQELNNHPRLAKRIIFTGYVADEDLAPLYSDALAFCYPSLYEGFGLPPLEAMQCGTPVIASNASSLPEVVSNAGLLINPYDIEEIADALLKVYQSASLRQELSQKSIERAQQFTWQSCAEKTVGFYHEALNY